MQYAITANNNNLFLVLQASCNSITINIIRLFALGGTGLPARLLKLVLSQPCSNALYNINNLLS